VLPPGRGASPYPVHVSGPLRRTAQLIVLIGLKARSGNAGSSAMVRHSHIARREPRLRHATRLKARRHLWWLAGHLAKFAIALIDPVLSEMV
jgi:hypothetical protein